MAKKVTKGQPEEANQLSLYFITLGFIALIVLRILLMKFPGLMIDMADWQAWTERLVSVGPLHFYATNYFADYFPGYLYILWILGNFLHTFFPQVSFASDQYIWIIKFITTTFEIGTAYIIYKIVNNYNKLWAYIAAFAYLGNIALIFNSSVWGQVDGVPTFFLVLAAYQFQEKEKIFHSSIANALAIIIKPQTLVVLPAFLLAGFRQFPRKPFFLSLLLLGFIPLVLAFPFLMSDPILGLVHLFFSSENVYRYTSLYAFNLWAILGWWKPDNERQFLFTNQIWGYLFYGAALIAICIPLVRTVTNKKSIPFYLSTALMAFAFYLFPTRIHERYLFPFFAFLLIAACIKQSKLLIGVYIVTAIIHFLNLWYVYFYYNIIYNNPAYRGNFFFSFVDNYYKMFSAILIGSFFVLLWFYYKSMYETESHKSLQ